MPIENVAIAGIGLIGGSLARAWRAARPDLALAAFDRPDVLRAARDAGVIDREAASLASLVAGADLVVLALPLDALLPAFAEMAPHLAPGALVTDVGSVKTAVARAARVLPGGQFVGGHPMAGAEKGGFAHADPFLFENAVYVLCPDGAGRAHPRYPDLVALVEATGARVLELDAHRHDAIAARVSHVPQLVATALAATTGAAALHDDALLALAAGGFRDMTRIAESPFAVWQGILAGNRAPVREALGALQATLAALADALDRGDSGALEAFFDAGAHTRRAVPVRSKGFLRPLHEIRLHALDRPGFLARATQVLFDAGLNVKDLELLKVREGTGGTFRLAFASPVEAEKAIAALAAAGLRAEPF